MPELTAIAYRFLLRLPEFKGRGRLEALFRATFLRPRSTRLPGGLRMELDPIEWSQAELLRDGVLEPLTVALFKSLLRSGDTYVDVGAHIGFHTLVARQCVGAAGVVIAIEPQAYNADRLLRNWRVNGFENLALIVAACGARNEWERALPAQSITDSSRLSLVNVGPNDERRSFSVPVRRLEDILAGRVDRVRLLKVDVEGHESQVLEGLGNLWSCIDHLVIEVLDPSGAGARRIADELRARGYELRDVHGQAWMPEAGLAENNLWAARVASHSEAS